MIFAVVLAVAGFLVALAPQGLRIYDTDLGPATIVNKIVPQFRIPNRIGIIVHFAVLLGAGALLSRSMRRLAVSVHLRAASLALGIAMCGLVLVEYLPLHRMPVAAVPRARTELARPNDGCGVGITVPYVSHAFAEQELYDTMAELRGTHCKIAKGAYLSDTDKRLAAAFGSKEFTDAQRARMEEYAHCINASWAVFRLDAPEKFKRAFCAEMGWTVVSADSCRAPVPLTTKPRALRECIP
jgi:hypothetical protein